MAIHIQLTPELETFAQDCVQSGRFNSVNEVIRSALSLLQTEEERRKQVDAMLDDIRQQTFKDGGHSLEDVMAEADQILAAQNRLAALRGTVIVGDVVSPMEEEWGGDEDHL